MFQTKESKRRSVKMWRMRMKGMLYKDIGEAFGLGAARARQLVVREAHKQGKKKRKES